MHLIKRISDPVDTISSEDSISPIVIDIACSLNAPVDSTCDNNRVIGPITFHSINFPVATKIIVDAIHQGEGRVFAFCNMHGFNLARREPRLAAALANATVFNDGVGMDFASRVIFGSSFVDNLNGTDLTPSVLLWLQRPTKVFLLGSRPNVARRAGQILERRFPNVRIVGTHHGFFSDDQSDDLRKAIAATGAELLLIGMGNPRQEIWADEYGKSTGAVVMCVGAFFDFSAGVVWRAPRIVQAVRLEWAFRLVNEPKRLGRRYIGGSVPFVRAVLRERRTANGRYRQARPAL